MQGQKERPGSLPYRLFPLGDRAVVVQWGETISADAHRAIRSFVQRLEEAPFPGMTECVAAYTTVTVYYDPYHIYMAWQRSGENAGDIDSPYAYVCSAVEALLSDRPHRSIDQPATVVIPVCYGGEYGPDLEHVAAACGLTPAEVVHIHTEPDYLVHMIGFAPGFPYLGGMSERIATPRRAVPRVSVPAGSVGIAGGQTGVYPLSTPGGWQLIGRTPLALFRPDREPPTVLQAGDTVRFQAISREEFEAWTSASSSPAS